MTLRRSFRRGLLPLAVVMTLAVAAPGRANTLFALVDTGEIYASADGGANWSARATLPLSDAAGLVAGATDQQLFLAAGSGAIYRSDDGGWNWQTVSTIPTPDVVDLAGYASGLLVLSRTGTVWRSTDTGASFQIRGVLAASDLVGLCNTEGAAFRAITRTGLVWGSPDAGLTWTPLGSVPASDVVTVRSVARDLYAITATGLTWKSPDQGATWSAVGSASQLTVAGLVQFMGRLMTVTREGLVALSATGAAWTWIGSVNQLHITALATDEPQVVGVSDHDGPAVAPFVSAPWPNPCRVGSTGISFEIASTDPGQLTLELFESQGRLAARRVVNPDGGSARTRVTWNPGDIAAGNYYLRVMTAGGRSSSRAIVLVH